LGTMFTLWPATLRTRMAPNAPRIAQRVLMLCGAGLCLAAVGLLVAHPVLAAVGMTGYAAGVGLSLAPFTRALAQRRPHDMASGSLAASIGWLLGAACWDVVALAEAGRNVELIADRVAPILAVGLVAQVLVGALSFLLPVLLGGGPAGNKRMATTLNNAWVARLAATNLGVLAAVLPLPGPVRTIGYAAALGALGSFLPLAVIALVTGARATGARWRAAAGR
ncbi:MAG: multicopper oxidase domain-containing protein, partial [Mycobacteriales bacterium]